MRIILLKPGDEALFKRAEDMFWPGGTTLARAAILLREANFVMIVALDDGRGVLGRIYGHILHRFDATDFLIYEVDVAEAHQREGVGRAMIEALKSLAAERDWREMWVLTEVGNAAGNALYEASGGQLENSPANMYVFPTAKP
ncbi:MAG TPA: GNAT family N-acetyltransferase [Rhizomicrobium sp.]